MDSEEFLAQQKEAYRSIGLALVGMANDDYAGQWRELRVNAKPLRHADAHGWTLEMLVLLKAGGEQPLIARPALVEAVAALHRLFEEGQGKGWDGVDFRLSISPGGPLRSSCSYSYDDEPDS